MFRCDDALNFSLSEIVRKKGDLLTNMKLTSNRIVRCVVIISFGTNDVIGGGVLDLILVDELHIFITSLKCVKYLLLAPMELTEVFLMILSFRHILKQRRSAPPISLVRDFASFSILVCSFV